MNDGNGPCYPVELTGGALIDPIEAPGSGWEGGRDRPFQSHDLESAQSNK